MRILVCVKRVPAPGSRINVTPDGDAVDTAHLGFTTSPHEECAVEEAVQIAEQHDGEVTVLTLGPAESEEQLRYAASVGAHNLVLIPITEVDWDPQRTASALTTAISGIEAADGTFDLILFGNESADTGGFQVGIRVAHALGRPVVNGIKGIDLADGAASARREIDGGFEVYEVPMPAVLGIKEGINLPRYPTMKGRLASKKAEVSATAVEAAAGGQTRVRLHRPLEQVSETVILGTGPEAAPAVVDLLEELGVLS
ncbi:MAG: electron transfer flavoprotein subunit alpha [Acidimicrobiaceae bacterium]|jgi:electron transfer flavoprotein beta subunit|nr:electron transfer flavoprotein subunit alpha [Acidimicrobiaceae bacterium]MDP6481864.1 electron transfer flavoprotein subunit beta/FixA family protein [Acidimicrobiales bacterium]|tara:strand:- start:712 stop:1479 length:768 start_codon:yes stop_codon:yes gene_type:complete